jgi:23S rRNA (uracil1939-C5)-methyltransferase
MAENILINDLGPMGDGIHRSDDGPIYVPSVLPGERILADVRPEAGGVSRGDLREILTPSPHRVAAPCVHYDVCGGCNMQHAETAFYRDWKVGVVRKALDRETLEPKVWHEAVFLEDSRRRRATFAAMKKKDAVTLGYFRRRSHEISDISGCLVADLAVVDMRVRLGTALAPLLQEGKVTDVFIQAVGQRCDVVVTGPFGKAGKADLEVHEALAELARIPHLARLSWRAREHIAPETMLEVAPLHAAFGLLNVSLPPLAFLQPTEAGEAALVGSVLRLLPSKGNFADLFSGCGTFAGSMLMRGPVDAFEHAGAAVQALDKSKGTLPLKVFQRDLFRHPLQPDEIKRYDAIVFDPPRAGAGEQARRLAASDVPLLIAVSCNPATFARDARILLDGGYHFETMKIIDQFPWTHHVELVASFRKMR